MSQVPLQAVYRKQEAALEDLQRAAREIAEMHEVLIVHKQRIPTVDTVRYAPSILSYYCNCSSHMTFNMHAILCRC